jgi:hypothetical protein
MILLDARSKPGRALRLALLVLHVSVVGLAPAADAGLLAHSHLAQPLNTSGGDTQSHHDSAACQFCQLIAVSGNVPAVALGYIETPQVVSVSATPAEQHPVARGYRSTIHSRAPPQA